MASKKKRPKKTGSPKKPKTQKKQNWSEEAERLLSTLLKPAKSPQAGVFVFSKSGDLIFKAGKTTRADVTSLGVLACALRGLRDEFNTQLKTKANWAQFGEDREGFWVDYFDNWIIVAKRLPYTDKWAAFRKHLRKYRGHKTSSNTSEAMAGLSEAAVDLAWKQSP